MSTPIKKRKLKNSEKEETVGAEIEGNKLFNSGDSSSADLIRSKVKEAWKNNADFKDGNIAVKSSPFRHGEITDFIPSDLQRLAKKFGEMEFTEKASDLFQFKQSLDLKSFVDPHVHSIMEYLSTKVLTFLKDVTSLPLNDHIDLFLSDYQQTDFLLCHDDELDSRRIAFILYLSEEWKPEFGGNLDLFSATDEMHPDKIVVSVTPEFNKFVFFEVGVTSFHQVSEVTEPNVRRLALSGWFYGDPLPRPKIDYPHDPGYSVHNSIVKQKGIFQRFCSSSYLTSVSRSDINEQLTEESQVFIPGFLEDGVYAAICKDIVEQDVEKGLFTPVGPANLRCYEETPKRPPPQGLSVSTEEPGFNLEGLEQLLHSEEFMEFLETITEFPFTSCNITKVTSSLRKYKAGSYSLMKTGGKKQTGGDSAQDQEVQEDEEEDEDPNYVDVTLFFGSKWKEGWGGLTIYSTVDGDQLITIPPEGNCLAVVVRTTQVNSYLNYINCRAKDELFFAYNMNFVFNGIL